MWWMPKLVDVDRCSGTIQEKSANLLFIQTLKKIAGTINQWSGTIDGMSYMIVVTGNCSLYVFEISFRM